MIHYSTKLRTRKNIKGYGLLSYARNLSNKYQKKLLDTATKTRLDAAKAASKKVVHKTAKTASELIGNKTAEKNVKQRPIFEATSKNVEEIFVPPEKRENILSKLRKVS